MIYGPDERPMRRRIGFTDQSFQPDKAEKDVTGGHVTRRPDHEPEWIGNDAEHQPPWGRRR